MKKKQTGMTMKMRLDVPGETLNKLEDQFESFVDKFDMIVADVIVAYGSRIAKSNYPVKISQYFDNIYSEFRQMRASIDELGADIDKIENIDRYCVLDTNIGTFRISFDEFIRSTDTLFESGKAFNELYSQLKSLSWDLREIHRTIKQIGGFEQVNDEE